MPSSGCRIDRVIDGRTEIAAAVVGMLRMKGKLCEIDVFARDLDLVHGRFVGIHLHDRLWIGDPPDIFAVGLCLSHLGRGDTAPWSAARASHWTLTRAGWGEALIGLHSASSARSSSACGTTSLTMPASRARCGSMTAVDQTRYVIALRGTRSTSADMTMVGMMLWAISGTWNLALSAASVMSQTAAMAQPKPKARPCTTPMTGISQRRNAP